MNANSERVVRLDDRTRHPDGFGRSTKPQSAARGRVRRTDAVFSPEELAHMHALAEAAPKLAEVLEARRRKAEAKVEDSSPSTAEDLETKIQAASGQDRVKAGEDEEEDRLDAKSYRGWLRGGRR